MFVPSPVLRISIVHFRKISNIAEEDVHFDGRVEARARFFKHGFQICDALMLSLGVSGACEIILTYQLTVQASTSPSMSLFVEGSLGN